MLGLTDAFHIGFSAALTSVTTAGLGLFVGLKDKQVILYRVFSAYSCCIALWSAFLAVHVITTDRAVAEFTGRYLHIGAVLIPVLFVHFVKQFFADEQRPFGRAVVFCLYLVAGILMLLCINGTLVPGVAPKYGIKFLMIAGPGYIFLVLFFVGCAAWGLARMFLGYLRAGESGRTKLNISCSAPCLVMSAV